MLVGYNLKNSEPASSLQDVDSLRYGSLRTLQDCVHCGFCLPSCPTYRVLGTESDSPRGRIDLMKAYANGEIGISNSLMEHISLCLVCRNCETACPSGVRFGWAMDATRARMEEEIHRSVTDRISRRIFFSVFENLAVLRTVMRLLRLYNSLPLMRLSRLLGLSQFIPLTQGVSKNSSGFISPGRGRLYKADGNGSATRKVGFLVGCIMSTLLADIDHATLRVLNKNGSDVVLCKGQTCCGALHLHEGEREKAKKLAKRNIDAFAKYPDIEAIIVNSSGCGAQMKEYGVLLEDDPQYRKKAMEFSSKVKDFSEFLYGIQLNTHFSSVLDIKVTYQDPCHLAHGQGIRIEPREILKQIPGIHLQEMDDSEQCCGAAGIYSVLNPAMAEQILSSRIDSINKSGAKVVVASNPPCIIQYGTRFKNTGDNRRVMHIAELLDQAYSS